MELSAEKTDDLAVALFGELFMADQLARNRISKVLPKGMELSHFSVLNHLAHVAAERTPAQLARTFHLTRGAMTNTLGRLEWAGWVHIRPDWDDARRKLVSISPTIILKGRRPFAALGTPGAARILTTMPLLISNLLDYRMGIQQAIEEPRFFPLDRELTYEPRLPEATLRALDGLDLAAASGLAPGTLRVNRKIPRGSPPVKVTGPRA